jgi:alpha/beta superfamily hydrolase
VDGTGGSLTAITPDGAVLAGDLTRPPGPVRAAVVICHPHPDHGGDRFNIVVDTLFQALPRHGLAATRFDFRRPVAGRGEQAEMDVRAMIHATAAAVPDAIMVLAGYSFGAGVGLSVAASSAEISAIVAIAPPAPMIPLDVVAQVPTLAIVPAHDQFGPPIAIAPIVAAWPRGSMVVVESADHFLAGHTATVATRVIAWLGTLVD